MDSLVGVAEVEDLGGGNSLNFLLGKESPAKKTSKKFEMEVNSISNFEFVLIFLSEILSLWYNCMK